MIIATMNLKGEITDKVQIDLATIDHSNPLGALWLAYQRKHPKKTYVDVTRVVSYSPVYKTEKWRMYQGNPQKDIPKSWKPVFSFIADELSGRYNSGSIEVYKYNGVYRYATYRDGCFWQYMGVIIKQ